MRHINLLTIGVAVLLGCLTGCGGATESARISQEYTDSGADLPMTANSAAREDFAAADPETPAVAPANTAGEPTASIDRKIIYTADVDLVVEDFSKAVEQIQELVQRFKAIIANSNVSGTSGERRSGLWRLRVPAAEFENFLKAVDDIGEVNSKSRDSKDVTEEFYDVAARIRNKKIEEAGLIKILEERTGKLEDVLAVERELSRVRGEIERMEGRLRLLKDLVALTTVTLRVQELTGYVPEQAPEFGTRVDRSWKGSLTSLREFGASCVVWLVGAGPWLVVVGLPLGSMLWVVRRRWRKRRARSGGGE